MVYFTNVKALLRDPVGLKSGEMPGTERRYKWLKE
jgi:hypothetical protein